jgi:hypothetical protein
LEILHSEFVIFATKMAAPTGIESLGKLGTGLHQGLLPSPFILRSHFGEWKATAGA